MNREIQSCLYVGSVRHRRHEPTDNRFRYRLFMMYLDLAELPTLFEPYFFWSARRAATRFFKAWSSRTARIATASAERSSG